MFKAIIVDNDLQHIRKIKKSMKEYCPQLEMVAYATDIKSAQKLIGNVNPDLVIMDIQFKAGNGFELLDKMIPYNFEIIFTVKNDQHSLKAIKYNALDYVLKPISNGDLQIAGQKAVQRLTAKYLHVQMELILNNIRNSQHVTQKKVAIPTVEGFVFISLFDIVRCEANGAYTMIFTNKKEKIIASRNIKEYEDLLPKNLFFRVHNSHLVNINRILRYNKGRGGTLTMEDGTRIEVASRRRNEFINMFQ